MREKAPVLLSILVSLGAGCATTPGASESGAKAGEDVAAPSSASSTKPDADALARRSVDPAAAALYDEGNFAAAAEAFEKAYNRTPRSARAEQALYWTADAAMKGGRYEHALETYERLLKQYPATEHYPEALEKIFQVAKLFVEEKAEKPSWFLRIDRPDRDYGIEALERFVKQRDHHPLAPEALFLVGEAHLKANEPELAIESWQRLVKEYPASDWSKAAEYKIALAFLALNYGVEYDKRPLMTALRRLRSYVRKYPTGDHVQEAEERVAKLEDDLARHDLGIAKRYARDDHYASAQIYLTSVRREYPRTKAAEEAKVLAKEWPDPPLPQPPKDEEENK
ncbi:outer membrane protein assembly factor BamD [bacterium]|nr:outer membrane protein assembly factor BamD [bacterium]